MEDIANLRMMKVNEVTYLTGLSKSSLYQKIRNKEFPAPIKLGKRSVAWRVAEIQSYLENLCSRR